MYNLNIAGYKIRFENTLDKTDIIPSQRFSKYISTENKYDFLIKIQSGKINLPENAVKVFDAPYVEEIGNTRVKKSDDFWSVFQYLDDLFISVTFPGQDEEKSALLKFSLHKREWDLLIYNPGKSFDPMEYPLDGLILYYLTVIKGDIMIHASGVSYEGKGYIFSGISGKGKTTMAGLWVNKGARIIHDDRLIIRKTDSGYSMYNTPVYRNDQSRESRIDSIFLIDHGTENSILPLKGAAAITLLISNCIQHNWSEVIIKKMLSSAVKICTSVPVYNLRFRPDKAIIDYILQHE